MEAPRPNVLAYPSPTTSRFLVFLAALLASGAFVGGWVHNQVLGDEWLKTAARCDGATQGGAPLQSAIERNAIDERCRAFADAGAPRSTSAAPPPRASPACSCFLWCPRCSSAAGACVP